MLKEPGLVLAMIALWGIVAQWVSWWLRIPAILFLLIIGVVTGPVTGLVRPDELFGDLLFPMVSLGVAVILFEGSLTLRLYEIRGLGSAVRNLVSIGALINWLIMSVATAYFMKFTWDLAFLFGALVTVTGPTVIAPMLRSVRPVERIAHVLRWEGVIIDPLGALLAVLVFSAIVSGQDVHPILIFGKSILIGGVAGIAGAFILATFLRRHWLPDYLNNVAALALVLSVFTISNVLQHESGLLAVTVMGIWLANMRDVPTEGILNFKESLSVILISALFIVLAARIDFTQFTKLDVNALYVLAIIIFVARPVAVLISTLGSDLNWREKSLIAWIGPRGIVAAAVAPLFVLKMNPDYYANEELLVPLVFMVIVGTVVLQSFTARPLARLLKVAEPEPRGILIVGANKVSREIAKELCEHGYRTLLADTTWSHLREARMEGLETYYGNVVSAHADRYLSLAGLGRLFAMSRHPALNALACMHYKLEFGAKNVFTLETPEAEDPRRDETSPKRTYADRYRSQRLFGKGITFTKLARLFAEGAVIRATLLTKDFDFSAYLELHGDDVIPLFALDRWGLLHVFTAERPVKPDGGWTVIGLLSARAVEEAAKNGNQRESVRRTAKVVGQSESVKVTKEARRKIKERERLPR